MGGGGANVCGVYGGVVVLWYCGVVVLWYGAVVVLWYCGVVVLWYGTYIQIVLLSRLALQPIVTPWRNMV